MAILVHIRFLVFVLIFYSVEALSWRQTDQQTERLPASKICRTDLDCFSPEECVDGYCRTILQCRWPGRPYYGNVIPDKQLYDVDETVQFTCQQGYSIFGVKGSKCLPTGHWSNPKPRCVALGCAHPGRPYHGSVNPDKEWYNVGEIVVYQCKSYYSLGGIPRARCREDGTWSDQLPLCNDLIVKQPQRH